MASNILTEAIELLEKANANLEPELLTAESARRLLDEYARAEKLASYGKAVPARRVDDAAAVARATGTSMGVAKQTVEAGVALADAPEVGDALGRGEVSHDQAGEIARAERARPGCSGELLSVARGRVVPRPAGEGQDDPARSRAEPGPGRPPARSPVGPQLHRRARNGDHQPASAPHRDPDRQPVAPMSSRCLMHLLSSIETR